MRYEIGGQIGTTKVTNFQCISKYVEIETQIMNKHIKDQVSLGTWQFSDEFGYFPKEKAIKIIDKAISFGINHFDTASVYGNGKVEKLLGEFSMCNLHITTKIPALTKPSINAIDTEAYYPKNYIEKCYLESYKRIGQNELNCILLHNWSNHWNYDCIPIQVLNNLKKRKDVNSIGISFPNEKVNRLVPEICEYLDVIEAPYNHIHNWIIDDIEYYKKFGIKILLRSIFVQGLRITSVKNRKYDEADKRHKYHSTIPFDANSTIESIFRDVLFLDTLFTFGVKSVNQLSENLNIIKTIDNENKYSF